MHQQLITMNDIRILSLFSGGGGLDIGFKRAGFEIVGCLEIDKPSCDTLELNRGTYVNIECHIFNNDITTTSPEDLDLGSIDFIIGGPPCQSFSAAGRRAGGVHGINDTRGSLFWYYCQYLKYFKPKGFLFENVRGILNANKSKDWEIIKKSFSDVGYQLHYRVLDAAFYGVPQHRERVIMVGVREDLDLNFRFPRPTHGPDSANKLPYVSVGEVFSDIDIPNEVVPPFTGKYGHLLSDIPPGQNYSHYTERMGHPEPLFAWRSKFSGFLYKLDPNLPSKTVVAHQGKYDGPFHWKNRKLNPSELKRVQSFPDDYRFVDSHTEIVRQIGNSVPPKMANYLAMAISNQFFGGSHKIELVQPNETLSFDERKAIKARQSRKTLPKMESLGAAQLNLLELEVDWVTRCGSAEVSFPLNNKNFNQQYRFADGRCNLELISQSLEQTFIAELEIIFDSPIGKSFKEISAKLTSNDVLDLSCLWDAIHRLIGENCSYENLQPLYGHFTEPYPKFRIEMKYESECKLTLDKLRFMANFVNFDFLKTIHSLDDLINIGLDTEFIKDLRKSNFDIRTHETNRTIPENSFRVCYPFSLSHSNKNYVIWRDKGTHNTGDFLFDQKVFSTRR